MSTQNHSAQVSDDVVAICLLDEVLVLYQIADAFVNLGNNLLDKTG